MQNIEPQMQNILPVNLVNTSFQIYPEIQIMLSKLFVSFRFCDRQSDKQQNGLQSILQEPVCLFEHACVFQFFKVKNPTS